MLFLNIPLIKGEKNMVFKKILKETNPLPTQKNGKVSYPVWKGRPEFRTSLFPLQA